MTVYARINHDRWLADCPAGCGGAELVTEGEPFVCGSCYPGRFHRDPAVQEHTLAMARLAGGVHEVVFPEDRAAIEAALAGRPELARNWTPGETVADLEAENAQHAAVA